jgi:hypothetical protein
MTWLQFIASVIGSVAWPFVIIVLLVILRKQIVSMAERITEISLPGGAKAKFEKQLQRARALESKKMLTFENSAPGEGTFELDVPVEDRKRIVPETEERRFLRLVTTSPEAAIVDAYQGVEQLIFERIAPLLRVRPINPSVVVAELVRQEFTDTSTLELFNTLREARNTAVHASHGTISAEEAMSVVRDFETGGGLI